MEVYVDIWKKTLPVMLKLEEDGYLRYLVPDPTWTACQNLLHPTQKRTLKILYKDPSFEIPNSMTIGNHYWIGSSYVKEMPDNNRSAAALLKR